MKDANEHSQVNRHDEGRILPFLKYLYSFHKNNQSKAISVALRITM